MDVVIGDLAATVFRPPYPRYYLPEVAGELFVQSLFQHRSTPVNLFYMMTFRGDMAEIALSYDSGGNNT